MLTVISARLAKDWNDLELMAGYRVLCGRRRGDGTFGCGGEIGMLISASPRRVEAETWDLMLGPGMVLGQDGVWQLARRAQGRIRHVTELASNPSIAPPVRARARRLLKKGIHSVGLISTTMHWRAEQECTSVGQAPKRVRTRGDWRFQYARLPCEVRCPRCTVVNLVEENLSQQARERFLEEEAWCRSL